MNMENEFEKWCQNQGYALGTTGSFFRYLKDVTLKDGRHVLVYNNSKPQLRAKKAVRTPLNLALSEDGIHWKPVLTLEDSPIREYSYPAIIQGKDGKLHITFTWRRELIKYMKIDLDKL